MTPAACEHFFLYAFSPLRPAYPPDAYMVFWSFFYGHGRQLFFGIRIFRSVYPVVKTERLFIGDAAGSKAF